jgi:hypothetical protein
MKLARNLATGALAGVIGTAAMDLLLFERYRRQGGKEGLWRWETAGDVMSWNDASAPGKLGERALRAAIGHEPPDEWARATTNIVHWATGVAWGIQYGAIATITSRHPWLRAVALGPVAWLSGYIVLPLAKVYKPIWDYDARTLGDDLSAHLVYGSVVSATFAALTTHRP